MKLQSNSGVRRDAAVPARRSRSAPRPSSTAPVAGESRVGNDSSTRRAARKRQSRQRAILVWCGFAVVSCGFAWGAGQQFHEMQRQNGIIQSQKLTLAALEQEANLKHRELDAESSADGHERQLIRYGYLKPGSRILLFPRDSGASSAADATDPIAPARAAAPQGLRARLRSAWRVLSGRGSS